MAYSILSIGQCLADEGSLSRAIQSYFTVEMTSVATAQEGLQQLEESKFDLILVNRLFDRDGGSGIQLIRELKQNDQTAEIPVMLISNFEQAQQEAMALGAVPGFGKSQLGEEVVKQRMASVLN